MKLKLIYDTSYTWNFIDDCIDDCGDDENSGYCSDYYINSRHDHERLDYGTLLHGYINKYCKGKARTENMHLVDIPDEIMLQYMLEGVYDMDWISYDFKDSRICISNTSYGALQYGEEHRRYCNTSGTNPIGYPNQQFFEFDISHNSSYDLQNETRKDYMIVPDGEHYKNIKEVIEPYVNFRFSQHFTMCSDIIRSSQDFGKGPINYSYAIDEDIWYEDRTIDNILSMKRIYQPDELKCLQSWDINYETFLLCHNFWRDDHPIFLASKPYLSDFVIESFRLMDARIKSKLVGTNK